MITITHGIPNIAFEVVKNSIIKIATNANNGNFESIDSITELGEAYRWKIAYLYSDNQLVPIYKKELFAEILIKGISCQFKQGIFKQYILHHDSIPTFRGKLDMRATIHSNNLYQIHTYVTNKDKKHIEKQLEVYVSLSAFFNI